ncbi:MAG: ABC transporter ATP-binding protein [Candidatus Nomurabacteria bacterium]|jgi:multidrug/hemolysin transport system ATP-binding protein|nr:ABC transporter ATP-binding protein [Candidatus Nomurabacteria bacterium]
MNILEVKNLTKTFGRGEVAKNVVDDLSFAVKKGSFLAFLGQNGAGKSTTINMILQTLAKTAGEIIYAGGENFTKFKQSLGVVFQENIADNELTVKENLLFMADLATSGGDTKKRYVKVAREFGLQDIEKQKFKTLSGGQKRKVELARALFWQPEILFLDEPTTGLDPKTRAEIWKIIKKLHTEQKMTVFLTTHYMEETETADDVIIIHKGKMIAEGSPAELKARFSEDSLLITPIDASKMPSNAEKVADSYRMTVKTPAEAIDILEKMKKNVKYFEMRRGSMDDVFLSAVGEKIA